MNFSIENIIIIITAYLLGTIPSAYLLVKLYAGKDIRALGTGNIGAMNSYDITGKKWLGIAVFILDAAKGVLAVLFARFLSSDNFTIVSIAAIFAILGHNHNVFLKFKGGRGLSTATGAFLLINPIIIIIWISLWLVGFYIIKRQVHVGNITATILTPLLLYIIPYSIIDFANFISKTSKNELLIAGIILCVVIFIRHIKPLIELLSHKK